MINTKVDYPIALFKTRKHSSRMRTNHAVKGMSSDRVAMRSIVNRMTDTYASENITRLSLALCGFAMGNI